jgi:hypothetical protein
MSAQIEARSPVFVGRTAMAAAVAGLIGVALTVAVAVSLLLGRASTTVPVNAPALIQPGYQDFGQRHRSDFAPVLKPGYEDFGQRHRTVSGPALEPGYQDYGQRHAGALAPALAPGYEDYGQRHRDQS